MRGKRVRNSWASGPYYAQQSTLPRCLLSTRRALCSTTTMCGISPGDTSLMLNVPRSRDAVSLTDDRQRRQTSSRGHIRTWSFTKNISTSRVSSIVRTKVNHIIFSHSTQRLSTIHLCSQSPNGRYGEGRKAQPSCENCCCGVYWGLVVWPLRGVVPQRSTCGSSGCSVTSLTR